MDQDVRQSDVRWGNRVVAAGMMSFAEANLCVDVARRVTEVGLPKTFLEVAKEKGMLTQEQIQLLNGDLDTAGDFQIDGYSILTHISKGGMGTVYLGRRDKDGKKVAIKTLKKTHASDPDYRERFLHESVALCRIDHENVVSGIEAGEQGGIHYLVQEYVDGQSCDKLLIKTPFVSEQKVLDIAIQTAQGLLHAHNIGLIHRDIKPENIIIQPSGVVKLMDLGLAKFEKGITSVTDVGLTVGTPNYISPEQARGEKIDVRTDIYSLGITLYHLLTGKLPFYGETAAVVMTKHLMQEIPPLSEHNENISNEMILVINKMVEKIPEDRYLNLEDLLLDLNALKRDSHPKLVSVKKHKRKTKRHRKKTSRISDTESVRMSAAYGDAPLRKKKIIIICIVIIVVSIFGFGLSVILEEETQSETNKILNDAEVKNVHNE